MLGLIRKIFSWINSVLSSLSEEDKNKVIESIVKAFEWILRKYYQTHKAN